MTASPTGPDVAEVVTGSVITAAWGTSVAADLTELWSRVVAIEQAPPPPASSSDDGSAWYIGAAGTVGHVDHC